MPGRQPGDNPEFYNPDNAELRNDPNWMWDGTAWVPKPPVPTIVSDLSGTPQDTSAFPTAPANSSLWEGVTRRGANAAPNANPYSAIVANQARPAQEALYNQMRATQAGPSIAGMQGTKVQGQNLQAALGAGGGRATMNQAGGIGAGVAGDTAMGTLAEQLRASAGIGSLTTGVRAADLSVAGAEANSGLAQRGLDDAMRQFYARQGAGLQQTMARNDLEKFKLDRRADLEAKKKQMAGTDRVVQTGATILGAG